MLDAGPFSLSIFYLSTILYLSSVSLFRSLKLLGYIATYLPLKLATARERKKFNMHYMDGWLGTCPSCATIFEEIKFTDSGRSHRVSNPAGTSNTESPAFMLPDENGLQAFLMKLYSEKDELKENFLKTGSFSSGGKYPVHRAVHLERRLPVLVRKKMALHLLYLETFSPLPFGTNLKL